VAQPPQVVMRILVRCLQHPGTRHHLAKPQIV